ncbi:MAG TPA: hypothetical protein VK249_09925 [Anaerolineales bacterium]|nr:hypothetical protein [Anaerolineales bacterium]
MAVNKQRLLVLGLIILGIVIVGLFGLRTMRAFRQFHGHGRPPPPGRVETDVEKIQDWMTIPFISRTYLVPDRMLFKAVGVPENGNRQKSLKELNDEYYPQADGVVLEKIKATILTRQPPAPP